MSPELLRAYLLGRASPQNRAAIEERLFADDTFEALLAEAEADLLDDWARGRLHPADATLIPQRFAKPKRDLARALAAKPGRRLPSRKWWALLAAAALILLAIALSRLPPGPPPIVIAEIRLQQQATRGTNAPLYRTPAGRRIRLSVPIIEGFRNWSLRIEPGAPVAGELANGRVSALFDLPDGRHQLLVSASRTSGGVLELVAVYPFELRRDVLPNSPLEK